MLPHKTSFPLSLPFKVRVVQCPGYGGLWYAKAALGIQDRPVFGFSCSSLPCRAAYIAKCECAEHLWASSVFFSPADLSAELPVRDIATRCPVATTTRQALLIGALDADGAVRNATGLAIGSKQYDPVMHAANEVLERHLLSLWWDEQSIKLYPRNFQTIGAYTSGILLGAFQQGFLAISVEIDTNASYTCFGSSFKQNLDGAISHAVEESAMLRCSLNSAKNISGRHQRLVNKDYCKRVFEKLCEIMTSRAPERLASIPPILYSEIYTSNGFTLVRAFSNAAHDVSLSNTKIGSPFL